MSTLRGVRGMAGLAVLLTASLALAQAKTEEADEVTVEPKDDRMLPQEVTRTITKTVTVDYLLYLPPDYAADTQKTWPLVIFLHGAGERGDDLEKVKIHGPPHYVAEGRDYPFILVAPQCPEYQWWDPDVILALLDSIMESQRVDPARVYLTGLSMGGFATWHTAAKAPQRFAAIAPICGGGEVRDAPKLKDVPVWAFHGAKDPIVPVARSQEMVDAVKAAGGDPRLTIYPEAGHDSWTATYEATELYAWLLGHHLPTSK